jgi:tetratricopeptide (TPR) repeat protein
MPGDEKKKLAPSGNMQDAALSRKSSRMNDSDISPQNQGVLLQIASLIRLAEGFRLGFVKCNQPVQCRQLSVRLKEMLASEFKIIDVELKMPVTSLRMAVMDALETDKAVNTGNRAIMVFGFEHSVPSEGSAPALDELNQSRENFPKSFSGPVLIWLPDYALTRLAREAPDFWGWRSGVFEFSPDLELISTLEKMAGQDSETSNLSLVEKSERSAALDGLVRDYQELQRGEREDRAFAAILCRLGDIRRQLGEYGEARRVYKKSLKIYLHLGDKSAVSKVLNQLSTLAYLTGDLGEARRLCEESLKIDTDLGDMNGVSKALHHLGRLTQDTGDLVEARRLYMESLKISQNLGKKNGVSISLHRLGRLAQDMGDLVEARHLYKESLKISLDLGDKIVVSKVLHQLGILAQDLGDLREARRMYEECLKIDKDLGDKRGFAITLAQYSLLDEQEGYLDRALDTIKQAESIFLELGSPIAARAQADRQRLEKKIGNS